MSACGRVASSFPLVVVWGLVLPWTTCLVGVLADGYCVGKVYTLSDIGVGFCVEGSFCYSGWRARICCVPSYYSRDLITTYSVVCSSSTSFSSLRIVAINFVCLIVYGGSSIYSLHLALCLALSILLFNVYKISRRSTGAGGSSGRAWSAFSLFSPRNFRALDIWGSFLALAAEPKIKTNFYSSSYANCYSLASLACSSTLVDCVPFYLALINFVSLSSCSLYYCYHLSSIASIVSVLTRTYLVWVTGYDISWLVVSGISRVANYDLKSVNISSWRVS